MQYEFIKSCGYVKVAVVLAKKKTRTCVERMANWLCLRARNNLENSSFNISPVVKGNSEHIYFYLLVRTPTLCLNLRTGLLYRKFPDVCDILDISDVSGVLSFRRQVIGLRQSDILY